MAVFAKVWVKGMTITNAVSCYKSVGVYPLDRRVALTHITQESEISQNNTPTNFVPFCTPQKGVANTTPLSTPPTDATTQSATFTDACRVKCFQACLQESEDSSLCCGCRHSIQSRMLHRSRDNESISEAPNTTSRRRRRRG